MSHELEAETLGKSRHLGDGNHLAPGATQHHHVSVVDHHASRHSPEVAQGFGEKHLAVETLKGGIHLEEQHARIAQDRRGRLHLAALAAQLELVRRGVVLNFFAWLEMVVSGRHDGLLSDAMPAAEGGQGRVRQMHSAGRQLLPHPHQIPLAAVEQFQNLLAIRFGLLRTQEFRYLR